MMSPQNSPIPSFPLKAGFANFPKLICNAHIFLTLLVFLLAGFSSTTGSAFGAASVDVAINGFSQGKAKHTGWKVTGDWSKQLRTQPGNHSLTAFARHPSGQFSPAARHNFSANTLETTLKSRGISLPQWNANDPAVVASWRQASLEFAQGASGNVRVLQPSNAMRYDTVFGKVSVWAEVEFGALQRNLNVRSITATIPETGENFLLWTR
jgi:hypothetical protein